MNLIPAHIRGPLALLAVAFLAVIPWFMIVFWADSSGISGPSLGFAVGLAVMLGIAIFATGTAGFIWLVTRLDNSHNFYREREIREKRRAEMEGA